MKQSEKPTALHSSNIRQDGNCVPVAARIFSNYVLLPARRSPDDRAPESSLQGAGVMTFTDQPQQQIKLSRSDAPGITGGAESRPAEKLIDKLDRSHESAPKGQAMTTHIACSACRTVMPAGTSICPSCGLQLVSQALPVVPARPWYQPTGPALFVLIVAALVGVGYAIEGIASLFAH